MASNNAINSPLLGNVSNILPSSSGGTGVNATTFPNGVVTYNAGANTFGCTGFNSTGFFLYNGSVTTFANGLDGQIVIGSTSGSPNFASLTSTNSNLTFTPGANSLALNLKIQPVFNTTVSGSAIPLVPGNSYLSNNTSVTQQYSLPSSPIVGDTYRICNAPVGSSSLGWTIIQSSGQQIVGIISGAQSNTTSGTSGHLDSAPTPGTLDSNTFVEIVYVGSYGGVSTFQVQSYGGSVTFV